MSPTCKTCRFYVGPDWCAECHRHAPVALKYTVQGQIPSPDHEEARPYFPRTTVDSFCGDHESIEPKDELHKDKERLEWWFAWSLQMYNLGECPTNRDELDALMKKDAP